MQNAEFHDFSEDVELDDVGLVVHAEELHAEAVGASDEGLLIGRRGVEFDGSVFFCLDDHRVIDRHVNQEVHQFLCISLAD